MRTTTIDHEDGVTVLALHGQLDIDTGPVLRDALELALLRHPPRIVVDLARLEFCDSTGLSVFILAHRHASGHGGWLCLAAPSPFLTQVLRTVGLSDMLPVYATTADARNHAP